MRGNQIFFTDFDGIRRIENDVVLPGVVTLSPDVPWRLDYASSVDRVYVSVIAATVYVAVIKPDPFGLDTTFTNGSVFQLNYLKYSSFKDRLYATQSDGTNLWVRVINPHTNSFTGNFQFSTNAAHEFQGGIFHWPIHDEIWVARQSDNVNNQEIRIYDGTGFAFNTSFGLGRMVPNDMIYIDLWGLGVCVGTDFTNNTGIVAWFDMGARQVSYAINTNTPSPPNSLIYMPSKDMLVADCDTHLLFIDMKTRQIINNLPISGGGNSMAYDAENQTVYHPSTGTKNIETFD